MQVLESLAKASLIGGVYMLMAILVFYQIYQKIFILAISLPPSVSIWHWLSFIMLTRDDKTIQ